MASEGRIYKCRAQKGRVWKGRKGKIECAKAEGGKAEGSKADLGSIKEARLRTGKTLRLAAACSTAG